MSDRPNTTCDHYGYDVRAMRPTCAKGKLSTLRDARAKGCVRGGLHHPWEAGRTDPCPLRDDQGQEARDAEAERVVDAVLADRCPGCNGALEVRETDERRDSWCPRCPDVSVNGCKRAGGPP